MLLFLTAAAVCSVFLFFSLELFLDYADSADRLAIAAGMSLSLTLLGGFVATSDANNVEGTAKIDSGTLDVVLLVINLVPVVVFLLNTVEIVFKKVANTSRRHQGRRKSFLFRSITGVLDKKMNQGKDKQQHRTKVAPEAGINNKEENEETTQPNKYDTIKNWKIGEKTKQ